jgi:hypothetical protein
MRSSLQVARIGLRHWGSNVRYPLLFIIMFLFIWIQLSPLKDMIAATGYATNPQILPFVLSDAVNQLIVMMGALFLFANAPFVDEAQVYVISRTGRRNWAIGQVIYVFSASACYVIALLIFSLIIIAPVSTSGLDGWGKIVNTLCYTDAGSVFKIGFPVSQRIVEILGPAQALGIQMLLEFFAVAIIGLVAFLINMLSSAKVGIFVSAMYILLDLLITNLLPTSFLKISSVSLARLSNLDFTAVFVNFELLTKMIGTP